MENMMKKGSVPKKSENDYSITRKRERSAVKM